MFRKWLQRWKDNEDGLAATEAAMVFPILLLLMLGTFDIGNGIVASYKTIRASQVTADLIARDSAVDNTMINEAIMAGELAMQPLGTDGYGVDIVSVEFDDNANAQILWRETRNMTPNANVLASVAPLAEAGSGVIVVTVEFEHIATFTGFSMGNFSITDLPMQEMAFARGRKSPVVERI